MKKPVSLFLALILLSPFFGAGAENVPYRGYNYDEWGVAIPTAVGYMPDKVYYGDAAGTVRFNAPEDMFVDSDGTVYVLDTAAGSVVVLDKDFSLVKTIKDFKLPDGSGYKLWSPKGIFVKDSLLYIADYDNMAVVVSDLDGNIRLKITKPEDKTFPQDSEFRPLRVLADSERNIYVLVLGVYQGAAVFGPDGAFKDFFGGNTVQPNVRLLMDRFWKRVLSREQRGTIANYVPVQFTSFDVLPNDFVYTCTGSDKNGMSELRCVNPAGKNIWASGGTQGDYEVGWYKNKGYYSAFVDVAATPDRFLFALDATKGRVFLYDPDGNMVMIFGGKGSQKGTFALPAAVETYGETVYVLDTGKKSVTTFLPTEYGRLVGQAVRRLSDGDYAGSRELWETVLKQDGNLYAAYYGIGQALYYSGKYKESMEYFRLAKAKESESKAFAEYRSAIIRAAFPYFMTSLAALAAALVCWRLAARKRKRGARRGA